MFLKVFHGYLIDKDIGKRYEYHIIYACQQGQLVQNMDTIKTQYDAVSLFSEVLSKTYFNIVCMSRAINMSIVSLSSLIFHMGLQGQIENLE